MNKANKMLQELGKEIIRTGYIIYDSNKMEEDLLDDNLLHSMRFLNVILDNESYYLRMRDGEFVEIRQEYDFPLMMKNEKYRNQIIARIKERYPDYRG